MKANNSKIRKYQQYDFHGGAVNVLDAINKGISLHIVESFTHIFNKKLHVMG